MLRRVGFFLREAFCAWRKIKRSQMGAAIAYFFLFSIAPFLLIAITLGSFIFRHSEAEQQIIQEIGRLYGTQVGEFLMHIIQQTQAPQGDVFAIIIGSLVIVWGATSVVNQLQDSLSAFWDKIPQKRDRHHLIMHWVERRFFSFLFVVLGSLLLLFSVFLSVILPTVHQWLPAASVDGLRLLNILISVVFVSIFMTFVYKFLPDAKVSWRAAWIGSLVSTVLFLVGKYVIGTYLSTFHTFSGYGAARTVVLLIVWTYYMAQLFLFGGACTRVAMERR